MGVEERVTDLMAPLLEDLAVELVDLTYGGSRLKFVIDAEGGLDTELLAQATRMISRELDEHDPVPGTYTLEVTSPGVERPLNRPEHYARAVGEDVALKLYPSDDGPRRLRGRLESSDDAGVVLVDADGERHDVAFGDINKAKTVFEWGPAPKPGQSKSKKAKSPAAKAKKSDEREAAAQ